MNATNESKLEVSQRIMLNTLELQQALGSGRATAVKIGEQAGAKVKVGTRVLWNVSKIEKFLNKISE